VTLDVTEKYYLIADNPVADLRTGTDPVEYLGHRGLTKIPGRGPATIKKPVDENNIYPRFPTQFHQRLPGTTTFAGEVCAALHNTLCSGNQGKAHQKKYQKNSS
jgi:hypothetical protein